MQEERQEESVAAVAEETMEEVEEESIESQIKLALSSRVKHFRDQADSLTFEGVRRLIEEDMGLQKYALDVHKRFIKQLLEKYLNGADDDNVSKNSGEMVENNICSTKELAESPETCQTKRDVKEPSSEDEEKMEDSPVMGLLTGDKSTKSEMAETEGIEKNEVPSESTIKKAIWKRASYILANTEKISMAGVRRLLEEDLEFNKNTLDPFKKFISQQLDAVIKSPKVSKSASGVKKRSSENSKSKTSKKISSKRSSDSSDSESDEIEDEVKLKKKVAPKGKVQKSEGLKKRKRPEKKSQVSSKKQNKLAEMASVKNIDSEDGDDVSEDGQSQSSAEKPAKKKEVSTPAYGKRVDHLKSLIKSCGMSVAPSVYKKAKQVPDNKREAFLIKELEEILSREGLSTNPTEKEIKEVKKRKKRAKELEGIDMSNIVSSSRRRSTTNFVAPPKPQKAVESKGDGAEDTDDSDDGDDEEEDEEEEEAEAGDGTQSEELNGDDDGDSE